MSLDILMHDLGGCEGCPVSIMRAYLSLERIGRIYAKRLGNHTLSKTFDVAIVTGNACINDQRIMKELEEIREKANIRIAYGSCASVGGITLFAKGGREPRPEHRTYLPVSYLVKVDYAIPGCPPSPNFLVSLLNMLKDGKGYFLPVFSAVAKAKKLSGYDLQDEVVLLGLCVGCGACTLSCPTHALKMVDGRPDLQPEKCIRCGTCTIRCPRFTQLLIRRFHPKIKILNQRSGGHEK